MTGQLDGAAKMPLGLVQALTAHGQRLAEPKVLAIILRVRGHGLKSQFDRPQRMLTQ